MSGAKCHMSNVTKGFTLIESLVAASLFVIAVTSATTLFVSFSRAQKESGLRQDALNQLTSEFDRIAQDIRLKKINFRDDSAGFRATEKLYTLDETITGAPDENPEITSYEYELGLFSAGSAEEAYFYYPANSGATINCGTELTKSLLYHYDGSKCDQTFRIPGVTLTDVKFYISPNYNPYPTKDDDCKVTTPGTFNGYYCTCTDNNQCFSPLSTCSDNLCLNVQPVVTIAMTAQIATNVTVTLQTTISSRMYK